MQTTGALWWQVVADSDHRSHELAADRCFGLGAAGIEERIDGPVVRLIAGFPSERAARDAAAAIGELADVVEIRPVLDDGLDGWREHAEVVDTDRFVIVPAWRTDLDPIGSDDEAPDTEPMVARPADGGRIVLHLDPVRTFGSGSHPTTRLCLDVLATLDVRDRHVLDVGTGSGVLAIGAAKLGAARVRAIDVDASSPKTAMDNAARNGVADRIRASDDPLETVITESGPFDVVVANLLAPILVELAPSLRRSITVSGTGTGVLIVSGLLADRADEAVDALVATGLILDSTMELDGWVAVTLCPSPHDLSGD